MKLVTALLAGMLCVSAHADVDGPAGPPLTRPDFIAARDGFARGDQGYVVASLLPAASHGDPDAQYRLFYAYMNLAPTNFKKAEYWLRESAASGVIEALNELGLWYYNGTVVKGNLVVAYAIFDQVRGAAPAPETQLIRQNRDYLEIRLSKAQLSRGTKLSDELRTTNDFAKTIDSYTRKFPNEKQTNIFNERIPAGATLSR